MRRLLLLLFITAAISLPLSAQPGRGVQVSSSLSETSIPLDGSANLTISVSGAADGVNVPMPETRDGGLRFMAAGRRYQMTTVNGEMSSSTQYDFVVMPLKTGRHLIEPMAVTVNGVTHTTPSQRLEVTNMAGSSGHSTTPSQPRALPGMNSPWGQPNVWPGLPPQPREDDVLLESEVEPEVVYKHQPVFYKLTLLSAVRLMTDPRYNAIAPTGFLRVPFDQENGVDERGGRPYDTSSITTAFFPLNEGDYTLPGTQIQITPSGMALPRMLRTQPHALQVLPLPSEGKPKSFTGAVGTRFDLDARLKQDTLTLGSSAELEFQVEGDGHLDLVPYPYLPNWENLEKKLGKSPSTTRADQRKISSSRTYQYRLKPNKEGTYELSGMAFAFFNPQEKRYETILAPTLTLRVEANPNGDGQESSPSDPSEPSESDHPVSEPGPTSGRIPSLPIGSLSTGLALLLAGTLLGRAKGGFSLRRRRGSKSKFGPHSSVKELLASLDRLAPGEDRPTRLAQLTAQGWSQEPAERLEALRQKANRALFGGSGTEDSILRGLDDELSGLLKEKKR